MVAIVYMLAGMSSRFGGSPKALTKVGPNNETLLEISLLQALKQPFSKIIFITNPLTNQLFVNHENKRVIHLKECLDISRLTHPELMSELGSVNFIGLQPNMITHLNDILVEFKEKNEGDLKIEALLPNDLNTLIEKGIAIFQYFTIEDTIKSLTYQNDIETMKEFLIKHRNCIL